MQRPYQLSVDLRDRDSSCCQRVSLSSYKCHVNILRVITCTLIEFVVTRDHADCYCCGDPELPCVIKRGGAGTGNVAHPPPSQASQQSYQTFSVLSPPTTLIQQCLAAEKVERDSESELN